MSGTEKPIEVLSDYKNLKYFLTKELNPHQTRWAEFLATFHFKIHHVKGKKNGKADALSR